MSSTFRPGDVNGQLDCLKTLEPNWDSYGALPIDEKSIQAAREFIARLPPSTWGVTAVNPTPNGGVQFEWEAGSRSLELEFEAPSTIRYLKSDDEAKIEEEDSFDIGDIQRAVSLLQWFASDST